MKNLFAMLFGALFSVGLMFSGMSNPKKVLDFLDIFGRWDASLAFVMIGAILIAFVPFQLAVRKTSPRTIFGEKIILPTAQHIDRRLIIGAIMFGVGWGLVGICPAPSLTLIGLGYYSALYFIIAMLLGMFIANRFGGRS